MNVVQMMTLELRDRAWWVVESALFQSPNKGFWACLGDLPSGMPRFPFKTRVHYPWVR